jgi:hypothetical protein
MLPVNGETSQLDVLNTTIVEEGAYAGWNDTLKKAFKIALSISAGKMV